MNERQAEEMLQYLSEINSRLKNIENNSDNLHAFKKSLENIEYDVEKIKKIYWIDKCTLGCFFIDVVTE